MVRLLHCRKCCSRAYSRLPPKFNREVAKGIERKWKASVQSIPPSSTSSENGVYIVPMFPYPSGQLHMGHVRVYTISDCLARFAVLNGKQVCHPIGWDAFGLPAENAAIQRDLDPKEWTLQNTKSMRKQLDMLGCRFWWDREISTCDPDYYKWTQWLFLKLHSKGLTRRVRSLVNWDPIDKTVLADEQIDEKGLSWRSGAKVEKKVLRQWAVQIPRYSKKLWEDLRSSDWKDIIDVQRNWIGNCDVYRFHLTLQTKQGDTLTETLDLSLEDPRDLLRATHINISSSHIIASLLEFSNDSRIHCIHPISGRPLPIHVSDSSVFGAQLDCGVGFDSESLNSQERSDCCGNMSILEIVRKAESEGWGGYIASRKLKDWVVSRQRYWGTPIPMIHCHSCGTVPVPEKLLPVKLPDVHKIGLSSDGRSPLAQIPEFVTTTCPQCNGPAERETDTLDTFFDSAWYFFRYLDPRNQNEIFEASKISKWLPIETYVGGKEHAVLHLFYARFIAQFLWKEGLIPRSEPIRRLLPQGMIKGMTFTDPSTGGFVQPAHVEKRKGKYVITQSDTEVEMSWEKMSKSKLNGVDPTELLETIGTDLTRLLIVADVSPRIDRKWNLDALKGLENWLNRVWWIVTTYLEQSRFTDSESQVTDEKWEERLKENYNFFVRQITFHLQTTYNLNTAITKIIGLTNTLRKVPPSTMNSSTEFRKCLDALIVMSSVFAPHIFAELWSQLHNTSIHDAGWPKCDNDAELDVSYTVDSSHRLLGRSRMSTSKIEKMKFDEALTIGLRNLTDVRRTLFGHTYILDSKFIKFPLSPAATVDLTIDECLTDIEYDGKLLSTVFPKKNKKQN